MANDRASPLPLPPSLWAATARAAPATPRLAESCRADVAIVGAGYSGLAAALRLREAGASVVVLEAGEPGWGASGRNGGQVIPGLKWDPDELVSMFGLAGSAPNFEQVALLSFSFGEPGTRALRSRPRRRSGASPSRRALARLLNRRVA